MQYALLSEAGTPGPFQHMPLNWQVNSIEAIAPAIGADVFHGTQLVPAFVNHLKSYRAVIVNLKRTLWDIVPDLAKALPEGRLYGYQEGPAEFIGILAPDDIRRYSAAHRACSAILCYDERALALFLAISGTECHWLPIPAPMAVYDRIRPRETARGNRIAIGSTIGDQRGAALSVLAAKLCPDVELLATGRDAGEVGALARLASGATVTPDFSGWLLWSANAPTKPSWLARLATCDAGLNLDTLHCYGRFVVDCAGLGVPCIGTAAAFMQRRLFPALTLANPADIARAADLWRRLNRRPEWRDKLCAYALSRLRAEFSTEVVASLWKEIVK